MQPARGQRFRQSSQRLQLTDRRAEIAAGALEALPHVKGGIAVGRDDQVGVLGGAREVVPIDGLDDYRACVAVLAQSCLEPCHAPRDLL